MTYVKCDFSYSCAAADKISTDLRTRAVSLRQLSYLYKWLPQNFKIWQSKKLWILQYKKQKVKYNTRQTKTVQSVAILHDDVHFMKPLVGLTNVYDICNSLFVGSVHKQQLCQFFADFKLWPQGVQMAVQTPVFCLLASHQLPIGHYNCTCNLVTCDSSHSSRTRT